MADGLDGSSGAAVPDDSESVVVGAAVAVAVGAAVAADEPDAPSHGFGRGTLMCDGDFGSVVGGCH